MFKIEYIIFFLLALILAVIYCFCIKCRERKCKRFIKQTTEYYITDINENLTKPTKVISRFVIEPELGEIPVEWYHCPTCYEKIEENQINCHKCDQRLEW